MGVNRTVSFTLYYHIWGVLLRNVGLFFNFDVNLNNELQQVPCGWDLSLGCAGRGCIPVGCSHLELDCLPAQHDADCPGLGWIIINKDLAAFCSWADLSLMVEEQVPKRWGWCNLFPVLCKKPCKFVKKRLNQETGENSCPYPLCFGWSFFSISWRRKQQ